MRYKNIKLSAFLFLGFGITGLQAQTMYIKQSNGTQAACTLSTLRKMTFSLGNLTVAKTDNNSTVYALNGLRYLNFTDLATNLDKQILVQDQMLRAYPNPTSNVLNIDLSRTAKGEGTLSLFTFEGKTVISRQVSSAGILSLHISHLPKGIYLCRYSNATEVKTIKIIKQ